MVKARLCDDFPTRPGHVPAEEAAPELVAEIERLYRDLQALPGIEAQVTAGRHRSPAYQALEAQIRVRAARLWHLDGHVLTHATLPTNWAPRPVRVRVSRPRAGQDRPLISGQRHRLTRVW